MEKRQDKRFKAEFRGHFTLKDPSTEGDGPIQDLSKNGCRLQSETTLPVGAEVELCIFQGEDPSPLVIDKATVQWVENKEVGLAFSALRGDAKRRLATYARMLTG